MLSPSPRAVALAVLREWGRRPADLDRIIDRHLGRAGSLADRDRRLAFGLASGAVQRQGYLDWLAARFCRRPLPRLDPLALAALRLGLFQLLFLDRVPAFAAVHETVAAAKALGLADRTAGFVNAVLRQVDRQRPLLPEPAASLPATEALAVAASLPAWLVARWHRALGPEAAASRCQAANQPAPLVLRANRRRGDAGRLLASLAAAGLAAAPGRFAPQAVRLPADAGPVPELPGYSQGLFQVQDEAAQLVPLLLGPVPGGSFLDACAGLGGKTTQLAELAGPAGRIVAVEPEPARRRLLAENLGRLGLTAEVEIRAGRLEEQARTLPQGGFQGVLLDAPCSGTGVLRRHPDLRWRRQPEDLARYQAKQLALLEAAGPLVAEGGVLVYATCSHEPEENEEVLAAFLARHPGFRQDDPRPWLPAPARELVDGQGLLRTEPARHDTDGFFAARLARKG
ncbi:MAG: 16S rRNA (cytosine(967)-C(5))-methyltransferase RsmB [Thermodesulfobacteriota bacterium]